MSTPTQMFEHALNAVKGWPSPYAVDKHFDYNTSEKDINAGSVVSLSADGTAIAGITGSAMAIFTLQSNTSFDVIGDDGNLVGNDGHGADPGYGDGGEDSAPSTAPRMSGLVAIGAYELESSEYVDDDYLPNDTLTSTTGAGANAGKLEKGDPYVDPICGVVSDGELTNCYGVSVLRFWPVWLPAMTASDHSLVEEK